MKSPKLSAIGLLVAGVMLAGSVQATTLRWARADDGATVDPHAVNSGVTHAFNFQIYESLIRRDNDGGMHPGLAESWKLTDDPRVWTFVLREGVKFHDGAVLTPEDVIFSIKRAQSPNAGMRSMVASVEDVIRVDDRTVQIRTKEPNPLLPQSLTNISIMNEAWSRANGVEAPQDLTSNQENHAVRNANGTGPYVLTSREPNVRSVLTRFDGYWGKDKVPFQVSEVIMTPIKAAPTRMAALLSGQVDFVQDVPTQDIERLRAGNKLRINTRPQNRTAFLGMNVGDPELGSSDVKGKNPFADVRVREALNMSIDRVAIQRMIMRGESQPTGTIAPPFVHGFDKQYAEPPTLDMARAKALLAEAGYPNGFSVTLHCANTFEAVCQSMVGMFGRVGVKINLETRSASAQSAAVTRHEPDFYFATWGVPTYDSAYIFDFLVHTPGGRYGSWNATRYSNAAMDAQIESLASEMDTAKRDATMAGIWKELQAQTLYLPVHNMSQTYAMNPKFQVQVPSSTVFHVSEITVD